jgi:hypothetical protein
MVIGVATTDEQLAKAYFRQGCFDFVNGRNILWKGDEQKYGMAIAVSQFTQAVEKSLKAHVLLQVGRSTYARSTHRVWSVDLQPDSIGRRIWADSYLDGELRKLRIDAEAMLGGEKTIRLIRELESLTPERDWMRRNSEYPWVEDGNVTIPAEFFTDEIMAAKFAKTAEITIDRVAGRHQNLRNERRSVTEILPHLH